MNDEQQAPKRGRPPKSAEERYRSYPLSLHPTQIAWIESEAERRGISRSLIARELIDEKMQRQDDVSAIEAILDSPVIDESWKREKEAA